MSLGAASRLESLGLGDSWLHRLDARVKILAALAFLVCVASFPKYCVLELLPCAALPLLFWVAGKASWGLGFRFIAVALPFSLALGALNPFLDAEPQWFMGFRPRGGVLSLISIMERAALSVAMLFGLMSTTPMPSFLNALSGLGVPRLFVAQTAFLHRYLFVVAEEGVSVSRAVVLRGGGRGGSWRVAGHALGSLFMRSVGRADRIHLAMMARGFEGELPMPAPGRIGVAGWVFLGAALAFCALARFH